MHLGCLYIKTTPSYSCYNWVILLFIWLAIPAFGQNEALPVQETFGKGVPKTVGELNKKGDKTGRWIEFYPSGDTLSSRYYNENGYFDGATTTFYKNGNILARGNYTNGVPNGHFEERDEKGRLVEEKSFSDGKLDGTHLIYFSNGEVNEKINYREGQLHGLLKTYYKNGHLLSQQQYENGNPVGHFIIFKRNGQVKSRELIESWP